VILRIPSEGHRRGSVDGIGETLCDAANKYFGFGACQKPDDISEKVAPTDGPVILATKDIAAKAKAWSAGCTDDACRKAVVEFVFQQYAPFLAWWQEVWDATPWSYDGAGVDEFWTAAASHIAAVYDHEFNAQIEAAAKAMVSEGPPYAKASQIAQQARQKACAKYESAWGKACLDPMAPESFPGPALTDGGPVFNPTITDPGGGPVLNPGPHGGGAAGASDDDGTSTGAIVLGTLAVAGLGYLAYRKWGQR
jgi:hypothetical protein